MNKLVITAIIAVTMLVASIMYTVGSSVFADDGDLNFKAKLDGFQEVPAISTTGSGTFKAKLSEDGTSLAYELSYSGLEGTTTLFAHIHLGQLDVNGGVSAFLCGGGGKPACTATSGTVTGTVTAADVIGPVGQGIAAGEFNELVTALRDGVTYANIHTNKHPGGEIRGQIK